MNEPHVYSVEWEKPDTKMYICVILFVSNSRWGKLLDEDRRPNTVYLGVDVYVKVDWEKERGNFGGYWKYSISWSKW